MASSANDQPNSSGMNIDTPNTFLKKSASFKSPVPKQKTKESLSKSPPEKEFLRPQTPPSNSKFALREPQANYDKLNLFSSPAGKVLAGGFSSMHTLKVPHAAAQPASANCTSTFLGHSSQAPNPVGTEFLRNMCSPQRGGYHGLKYSPIQSPYITKEHNMNQDTRNLFWNSNGPMSCSPAQHYYKSPSRAAGQQEVSTLNEVQIKGTRLFQSPSKGATPLEQIQEEDMSIETLGQKQQQQPEEDPESAYYTPQADQNQNKKPNSSHNKFASASTMKLPPGFYDGMKSQIANQHVRLNLAKSNIQNSQINIYTNFTNEQAMFSPEQYTSHQIIPLNQAQKNKSFSTLKKSQKRAKQQFSIPGPSLNLTGTKRTHQQQQFINSEQQANQQIPMTLPMGRASQKSAQKKITQFQNQTPESESIRRKILDAQAAEVASTEKTSLGCNCKKTRCLKLYCDCFAVGKACGPECNCYGCSNTTENEERKQAVESIITRNPNAFRAKIEQERGFHHKGCHCKRSGCKKKYCECYQAGVICTELCSCEGCLNCLEKEDSEEMEVNSPIQQTPNQRRKPSIEKQTSSSSKQQKPVSKSSSVNGSPQESLKKTQKTPLKPDPVSSDKKGKKSSGQKTPQLTKKPMMTRHQRKELTSNNSKK